MKVPSRSQGETFEEQVRTVARALWNLPAGDGGSEFYGSNEIDCVCRTEDVVHLIECTTERGQDKLLRQIQKLLNAHRDEQRRGNTVKLWIVTRSEPIPEQRTLARKDSITILSLEQFESRLFDAATYLTLRWRYPFGSATDPDSEAPSLRDDEYIPLPLTANGEAFDLAQLTTRALSGTPIVFVGPYGAGKSLTIREVFRTLREQWSKRETSLVPIALNLRDHWGQTDADEALRRHASKVGFEKQDQLVRSWNANKLFVLLDGFDELATQTWRIGPEATRRARRDALRLIRSFTKRRGSPVIISGRDHYFDSVTEMRGVLGLDSNAVVVAIGEFTEQQASAYLKKRRKSDVPLPSWLPRKPLLLGYLAAKDLLDAVLAIEGERGVAYAWDQFLDRICVRDATMAEDIEASAVRRILEYLAMRTRESGPGNGPLYDTDLAEAYKAVAGYEPAPSSMVLLQRLPGLTARDQEIGARSFVDIEMADTLRAGAIARFVKAPFASQVPKAPLKHPLSEFGCAVAALLTERDRVAETQYRVAAVHALNRLAQPLLALDCLVAGASREQEQGLDCGGLSITDGQADVIDLETMRFTDLKLESCTINVLRLGDVGSHGLTLAKCLFGRVEGASDSRGLPSWIEDPIVDTFDDTQTNAAILKLDLPVSIRVLLTVIRKLFVQRGSGRKESALYRGLPGISKSTVNEILDALRAEDLVYRTGASGGEVIWHGERSQRSRVMAILAAPKGSRDPLISKVRTITV